MIVNETVAAQPGNELAKIVAEGHQVYLKNKDARDREKYKFGIEIGETLLRHRERLGNY